MTAPTLPTTTRPAQLDKMITVTPAPIGKGFAGTWP
jgi:hypothetical protein